MFSLESIDNILWSKYLYEDTKGVIRIRISKKNRQYSGQKKKVQKDKQRPTKHTYKTKDRVTGTPLKTWGERRCSGRVSSSCSTSGTRRMHCSNILSRICHNTTVNIWWGKKHYKFIKVSFYDTGRG